MRPGSDLRAVLCVLAETSCQTRSLPVLRRLLRSPAEVVRMVPSFRGGARDAVYASRPAQGHARAGRVCSNDPLHGRNRERDAPAEELVYKVEWRGSKHGGVRTPHGISLGVVHAGAAPAHGMEHGT